MSRLCFAGHFLHLGDAMTTNGPLPGWYPDPSGAPTQRYFDGQQWTIYAPPPPPPPSIVINNTVGAPAPVIVTSGPNHALHLVLTLLTCGMWLPVWLIVAIASPRRVHVANGSVSNSNAGRIVAGVIAGLFALGLTIQFWPVVLCLAVLAGVGYLGYRAYQRAAERRNERVKMAARADNQHQAFMAGDSSGIYGQYPPRLI